jgi:hypothetical protein
MRKHVFLSHAEHNQFEAELFQAVLETTLADLGIGVWAYKRDQSPNQHDVGGSLPAQVKKSAAVVFLLSPDTGPTQWMELAYADAFRIPTFILLHQTTFARLRASKAGVPPLVMSSQCTPAIDWKTIVQSLRACCTDSLTGAQRVETGQ